MTATELLAVAEQTPNMPKELVESSEQDNQGFDPDVPFNVPDYVFAGLPDTETVPTRFGDVEISRKTPIVFPMGILGMPNAMHYSLVPFPGDKLPGMMWLQSLDDLSFGLIAMPINFDNTIIDKADMQQAAEHHFIPEDRLVSLLIVTIGRALDGSVELTANARAPLFINSVRRMAVQHVFNNINYEIKHPISK